MEELEKRNKKIFFIMTIISLVAILGVCYAFFSGALSNTNNEKYSLETATVALRFDDNDNGINATLNLGESITKKFTLENIGTKDTYARINWVDLVNTYMSEALTWTLEQSTSENGSYTSISSGNVPISGATVTRVLKNEILVPVNTKYYYKLIITLNNLEGVNQNSDIGATFSSYFGLEEGSLSASNTIKNLVAGEPTNTIDVITKTAPNGADCTNTLAYDGTEDNNLRYVGANPCNYVLFNGEKTKLVEKWAHIGKETGEEYAVSDTESLCMEGLMSEGNPDTDECVIKSVPSDGWRIIGIMNNVDDGTGTLETRIKLVRTDPFGSYSWDSSANNVNGGYGINDWTRSDLMQELNGDYLNTNLNANTMWYSNYNNQKIEEFDYTKKLNATAQELIDNARWFLGGAGTNLTWNENVIDDSANLFYGYERGTESWGSTSGQTCNDGACPRALDWTGKVALIYPSDYGFAVGGDVRTTCLGKNMSYYYKYNCNQNDWLGMKDYHGYWSLSPNSNSYNSAYFVIDSVFGGEASYSYGVMPAVYLKSDVSILSGNGSLTNPYVIG